MSETVHRLDAGAVDDDTYLEQLGYKPELKRTLGAFSSSRCRRPTETLILNRASRFDDIVKIGRTQLQNTAPMTLGREFGAHKSVPALPPTPRYVSLGREHLSRITETGLINPTALGRATSDTGCS
jgi:hypothetical protein